MSSTPRHSTEIATPLSNNNNSDKMKTLPKKMPHIITEKDQHLFHSHGDTEDVPPEGSATTKSSEQHAQERMLQDIVLLEALLDSHPRSEPTFVDSPQIFASSSNRYVAPRKEEKEEEDVTTFDSTSFLDNDEEDEDEETEIASVQEPRTHAETHDPVALSSPPNASASASSIPPTAATTTSAAIVPQRRPSLILATVIHDSLRTVQAQLEQEATAQHKNGQEETILVASSPSLVMDLEQQHELLQQYTRHDSESTTSLDCWQALATASPRNGHLPPNETLDPETTRMLSFQQQQPPPTTESNAQEQDGHPEEPDRKINSTLSSSRIRRRRVVTCLVLLLLGGIVLTTVLWVVLPRPSSTDSTSSEISCENTSCGSAVPPRGTPQDPFVATQNVDPPHHRQRRRRLGQK